jgi:hypothetical protein
LLFKKKITVAKSRKIEYVVVIADDI